MDEIVARAMQRWPDVPDVYGWLRLDRRGNWLVKSRATPDGEPVFERIGNPAVIEFIGRNYAHDERGRWFFQNGPQRVFVRPDYLPLVYRLVGALEDGLAAHTGARAGSPHAAWLDEAGALLLDTALGPGSLTDRDLAAAAAGFADAAGRPVEDDPGGYAQRGDLWLTIGGARVRVGLIHASEAASRFGFDPAPAPPAGRTDC
jgi:hypothetical protein